MLYQSQILEDILLSVSARMDALAFLVTFCTHPTDHIRQITIRSSKSSRSYICRYEMFLQDPYRTDPIAQTCTVCAQEPCLTDPKNNVRRSCGSRNIYRLVQIERPKLCPREFLTPFFRVRPRNFAHILWTSLSKTRRGFFFFFLSRWPVIRGPGWST